MRKAIYGLSLMFPGGSKRNIRKEKKRNISFPMFSGGRERVHWEGMGKY